MPVKEQVYGYSLRDKSGKRVYTGTTNNPPARRSEHKLDRKRFHSMRIETGPMTRKDAEGWEARSIQGSRHRTGNNPKYNKTADGQWHPKSRAQKSAAFQERSTPSKSRSRPQAKPKPRTGFKSRSVGSGGFRIRRSR